MNNKDLKLFNEALELTKGEFFIDSISILKKLFKTTKDDEIKDDILYNIGICYFKINDFEDALSYFNQVLDLYPDGKILTTESQNEYGKISEKCHYGIVNCYLCMNKLDLANAKLSDFEDGDESFIIHSGGEKITFKKLAEDLIGNFLNK